MRSPYTFRDLDDEVGVKVLVLCSELGLLLILMRIVAAVSGSSWWQNTLEVIFAVPAIALIVILVLVFCHDAPMILDAVCRYHEDAELRRLHRLFEAAHRRSADEASQEQYLNEVFKVFEEERRRKAK